MRCPMLLQLSLAWLSATAALSKSAGPRFEWKQTKHVLAFGDSYTFVRGTNGYPAYSFIGDYEDNFSFTPEKLLSSQIWGNYSGTSAGGPNWVEFLSGCGLQKGLISPAACDIQLWDFAFAGANAGEEFLPPHRPWITPFINQTQQWLTWGEPALPTLDKENTLVAMWIGINDINDSKNFDSDLNAFYNLIITGIFEQSVQPLYNAGYRNFLLVNLPPLDRTPSAIKSDNPNPSKEMIGWWNWNMDRIAKTFQRRHCQATMMVYDANTFLNGVLDNAFEYGLINTTHACPSASNPDVFTNPGAFGCNPIHTYFWFDAGHITSHVHELLAAEMLSLLESQSEA